MVFHLQIKNFINVLCIISSSFWSNELFVIIRNALTFCNLIHSYLLYVIIPTIQNIIRIDWRLFNWFYNTRHDILKFMTSLLKEQKKQSSRRRNNNLRTNFDQFNELNSKSRRGQTEEEEKVIRATNRNNMSTRRKRISLAAAAGCYCNITLGIFFFFSSVFIRHFGGNLYADLTADIKMQVVHACALAGWPDMGVLWPTALCVPSRHYFSF